MGNTKPLIQDKRAGPGSVQNRRQRLLESLEELTLIVESMIESRVTVLLAERNRLPRQAKTDHQGFLKDIDRRLREQTVLKRRVGQLRDQILKAFDGTT